MKLFSFVSPNSGTAFQMKAIPSESDRVADRAADRRIQVGEEGTDPRAVLRRIETNLERLSQHPRY